MIATIGYAVIEDGIKINVQTVSPTEISAKVNGLLVLFGYCATRGTTEGEINELWEKRPSPERFAISEVHIVTVSKATAPGKAN